VILTDKIEKFEQTLVDELKYANRTAAVLQNSKDLIKALKAELREAKERRKEELRKSG